MIAATVRSIAFACVLLVTLASSSMAEFRKWTYRNSVDQRPAEIEAEFAGVEGLQVLLKGKDEKVDRVPLADLGDDDKLYVARLHQGTQTEFHSWQIGETPLEARYVGVSEGMVLLQTKAGVMTQIAWDRLPAQEKVYVIAVQRLVHAAAVSALRQDSRWQSIAPGVTGLTLNPEDVPRKGNDVTLLAFSPDGRSVISKRNRERQAAVWDVATARNRAVLTPVREDDVPRYPRQSAWCFHPSGRELWVLESDQLTRWDLATGACVEGRQMPLTPWSAKLRLNGQAGFVPAMQFSPDGQLIAVAYGKPQIVLFHGETFDTLESLVGLQGQGGSPSPPLLISPDRKFLAIERSDTTHIWNLSSRAHMELKGRLLQMVDKGQFIATLAERTSSGLNVAMYEPTTGIQRGELRKPDAHWSEVQVSPVSHLVAIVLAAGKLAAGKLELCDWSNGETLAAFEAHKSQMSVAAFSGDGRLLATGDKTGVIKLWDVSALYKPKAAATLPGLATGSPQTNDAASSAAGRRQAAAAPEPGFVSLFDGRSLAGWQGTDRFYRTENGRLVSDFGLAAYRSTGDDLLTAREFGDFTLRLEYCLSAGAESGILLRAPIGDTPAVDPMEVQILDDSSPVFRDLDQCRWNGALCNVVRPQNGRPGPPGEWNDLEVTCQQRMLRIILNGKTVVAANLDEAARHPERGGPHPGLQRNSGRIGLAGRDSRGRVEYRNVRIKELNAADSTTTAAKGEAQPDRATAASQPIAEPSAALPRLGDETPAKDPPASVAGECGVCLRLPGKDNVNALAWSPDGKTVATGGYGEAVALWDAATGRKRGVLPTDGSSVASLLFAPGGTLLAASDDGGVILWDLAAKTARKIDLETTNSGRAIGFSPDGHLLAVACEKNLVTVVPIAGSAKPIILRGHSDEVTSVCFSPDQRLLASSSDDKTVRLWNTANWQLQGTLEGHEKGVRQVGFSPSGRVIASLGEDSTMRLWDAETGRLTVAFPIHYGEYGDSAFSPDGRYLAVTEHYHLTLRSMESMPDQGAPVAQDPAERLRLHSLSIEPKPIEPAISVPYDRNESRRSEFKRISFSPDGSAIATVHGGGAAWLWDLASLRAHRADAPRHVLRGHTRYAKTLAISPDSRLLASGSYDHTVRLWDLLAGSKLATLSGHDDSVNAVAIHPSGGLLASGGDGVILWDLAARRQVFRFNPLRDKVNALAFSADGKSLLVGGEGKGIVIVDMQTWAERINLPVNRGAVAVVVSPDSASFAYAFDDQNRVEIRDVGAGGLRQALTFGRYVHCLAFSPDGRQLALGGAGFPPQLCDVSTGAVVKSFPGFKGEASCLAVSPNGEIFAAGGQDPKIHTWDVRTGRSRGRFGEHDHDTESLAISPDGRWFVAGRSDEMIFVWNARAYSNLYYGAGVSENTGLHVGRLFADAGLLDPALGTRLLLTKAAVGHALTLALPRGGANDNQIVQGVLDVARKAADQILHGPLAVRLCDEDFNIRRIEALGDPAAAHPFAALNASQAEPPTEEVLIRLKKNDEAEDSANDAPAQTPGPAIDLTAASEPAAASPPRAEGSVVLAPSPEAIAAPAAAASQQSPDEDIGRQSSGPSGWTCLMIGLAAGAGIAVGAPKAARLLARRRGTRPNHGQAPAASTSAPPGAEPQSSSQSGQVARDRPAND